MKKEYKGQCIFCGEPISSNQAGVGYTKTKRKTVVLFHEICFHRTNEINKFNKSLGIDLNSKEVEKWRFTL